MGVIGGYSNPFSFLGGKTGGAIATGKQDMLDLDKFDLQVTKTQLPQSTITTMEA